MRYSAAGGARGLDIVLQGARRRAYWKAVRLVPDYLRSPKLYQCSGQRPRESGAKH